MIELISYCILGLCLVWTLGLMLYIVIENSQDIAKLEMEMDTHAMEMDTHTKRKWLMLRESGNGNYSR